MDYYKNNARELFQQYRDLDPERIHDCWKDLMPEQPGLACDIGAGSGRDSAWLAHKGWDVTAVEPSAELRQLGEGYTRTEHFRSGGVTWLDDSLPELKRLRSLNQRFGLILISAVWMHLPPTRRERAMRIVSELLSPGGIMVISLRQGPDDSGRFYQVTADEVISQGHNRALVTKRHCHAYDSHRRHIQWETLVFQLPDDGTGSLPLIRHIIVNDNKAASYKLGLLRVLTRIAESAPGIATRRTDEFVEIPFGLVGLFWLKIYMPLVLTYNLIQTPAADHKTMRGYGWAKRENFYSLQDLSPHDLRIGAQFDRNTSPRVIGAIRDACANIQKMPAHYITYPGQNRQVFECVGNSVRRNHNSWEATRSTLSEFGIFRIPATLWQTFSQYACWLEPAILNEWVRLMQTWNYQYDTSIYDRALQWENGQRDTIAARNQVQFLHEQGRMPACVWTQKKLRLNSYAIDHCFPWSRWLNNDLWNLLPVTQKANRDKGDKLPSAALLDDSKERILTWWEEAYLSNVSFKHKFYIESEAALPLVSEETKDPETVFHAMKHQRATLRANQQLAEWHVGSR